AVAFGEALTPAFRSYAAAVRTNAAHLAECLAEQGLKIVTGGTDSHMVVVDLRGLDVTGADVEKRGLAAGLTINKNMVPGDPLSPRVTSGIRVGTAAPTTRGMDLDAMTEISALLVALIREPDPEALRPRVQRLCDAFPIPGIG
ncbi:MAG: serine hydroxymethyltransferase, partial [Planctomycetes bacterium]|nr:serine hydroxymethyltransferase [Planctomycetota bacterium]